MGYCPYFCVNCGNEKDNGFELKYGSRSCDYLDTHDYYFKYVQEFGQKYSIGDSDCSTPTVCDKCLPKIYYRDIIETYNEETYKRFEEERRKEEIKKEEQKQISRERTLRRSKKQIENEKKHVQLKKNLMCDIRNIKMSIIADENFNNYNKIELLQKIKKQINWIINEYSLTNRFIFSRNAYIENRRIENITEKESKKIFCYVQKIRVIL